MDLEQIVIIPQTAGLYDLISMNKSRFIVEDISTKKKKVIPVTKGINNLKEIVVYTYDKNINVTEIFKLILDSEKGEKIDCSNFNDNTYREFFIKIVPNHDREQVFISHIKKIIKWYNILLENKKIYLEEKTESKDVKSEE